MIFGSVCSGIEAASAAWLPLGWQCAFVAEIDPFCCALLRHYYPETPNYGDMLKFKEWPERTIDVLVGGCPGAAGRVDRKIEAVDSAASALLQGDLNRA